MPSDKIDEPARHTVTPSASIPCDSDPLLVRIDGDTSGEGADTLLGVSIAVACGLGRSVRLIARPSLAEEGRAPIGPVDWDLARRAEEAHLAALVAAHADTPCPLDFIVLDRFGRDEIEADEPVVAMARDAHASPWHADGELGRFLADSPGSVLLVPMHSGEHDAVRIERIMISLDGSARAECALPNAVAIARRHGAELALVHVSPEPPLTAGGALDDALAARHLRAADAYLAALRVRHMDTDVTLRTRLLDAGDARRRLVDVADAERADLIVVAARGASGHLDVPSGSGASYVLQHASAPLLMVGSGMFSRAEGRDAGRTGSGTRPPALLNGRR